MESQVCSAKCPRTISVPRLPIPGPAPSKFHNSLVNPTPEYKTKRLFGGPLQPDVRCGPCSSTSDGGTLLSFFHVLLPCPLRSVTSHEVLPKHFSPLINVTFNSGSPTLPRLSPLSPSFFQIRPKIFVKANSLSFVRW